MKRRAPVPDRAAIAEEVASLPKADIKKPPRSLEDSVCQSSVGADRPVLFGARDRLPAPRAGFRWPQACDPSTAGADRRRGRHHEFTEATTDAKGGNRDDPGPRMARERPPGHGAE